MSEEIISDTTETKDGVNMHGKMQIIFMVFLFFDFIHPIKRMIRQKTNNIDVFKRNSNCKKMSCFQIAKSDFA